MAGPERTLPLVATRDLILFPKMLTAVFAGGDKAVRALEQAHQQGTSVVMALKAPGSGEEPDTKDIAGVGTVAKIVQFFRLSDGTVKALVEGQERVRIQEYVTDAPFYSVVYDTLVTEPPRSWSRARALMEAVKREFQLYVTQSPELPEEAETILDGVSDPGDMVDIVAANLLIEADRKQALLESEEAESRLMTAFEVLMQENELLAIELDISDRVHDNLERHQRKVFLRERIRLMQQELGEEADEEADQGRYLKLLEEKSLPAAVKPVLEKEIKRLADMAPFSAEIGVATTYLDNVFSLPWGETSGAETPDTKVVAKVLDDTHYGLADVKDRIVEYLAVAQLRQGRPPKTVLCFVGPPGVGKTSISLAIAEGLGRPLQRISLGGVRDEAEIRGHRRTYVGAMPGRIVDALKRAGVDDAVILLDELDKMESDWRGNPAAALMEVLDPVQNHAFRDTYLDLEYDLSHVFFLATANYEEDIPETLHDRLEIIRISGYTSREKEEIARRHLIPKAADDAGLADLGDVFSREALRLLIEDYTREPGVRELNRLVGKVYRRLARDRVEKRRSRGKVGVREVERLLGAAPYTRTTLEGHSVIGVSTGLAYTGAGGDILRIETAIVPGKGDFHLTGQLGEVMQESVAAAWGYLKTAIGREPVLARLWTGSPGRGYLLEGYQMEGGDSEQPPADHEVLSALEIRVHLPEGSVPKEGPSAGIAVAVSLLSALTGYRPAPRTAFSGEITLTGQVLAVGGLKEKLLAARREGVGQVVLPEEIRGQVRELPKEVVRGLDIVYVRTFGEVLPYAFPEEYGEAASGGLARADMNREEQE